MTNVVLVTDDLGILGSRFFDTSTGATMYINETLDKYDNDHPGSVSIKTICKPIMQDMSLADALNYILKISLGR